MPLIRVRQDLIEQLIKMVLSAADKAGKDAGYGGRMDDGGAARLREQVKFYEYGASGVVPTDWKRFEEQLDPDWGEYQRLRIKFQK